MKFNFTIEGKEKWQLSRIFIISFINFAVGFAVAWVMWSETAKYMIALLY